ncbi:MAG: YkgJ family cysteine cluster protein [Bacteroidia bacterium]
MNLTQDPAVLKALIREEKAEWNYFFKSLRLFPARQVDEMILPLAEEITALTNCRECGNCCKNVEPGLTEKEIERLAALKKISKENFLNNHTATEPHTGIRFMHQKPCIFLESCSCVIYEDRPEGCRNFPDLDRKETKFRLKRIAEHMEICPIVYNTMNILRQQLQN